MTGDPQDVASLRQLSVLLVEDDPDTRDQLAVILGRRTRRVLKAANGVEGLASFLAERPQLVVTDIQMPGMDGLRLAQLIREQDPQVPIIVTTAFDQPEDLARALDLGISHYVLKPIQMDRLEEALHHCARLALDGRQNAAAGPARNRRQDAAEGSGR